jgi:hypothetical protein
MDIFADLQEWYISNCNGEWEHHHGISIESCDNPGWWVKIDLTGTELLNKQFESVIRGDVHGNLDPQPPWLHCYIEGGKWNGSGDATTLAEILEIFLKWANGS